MWKLLIALSQGSQTRCAHQHAHQQKEVSQLAKLGNRPTNSSKQQHRRHNKLSLAKYRILIRLAGEYLQLRLASKIYQLAIQLLQIASQLATNYNLANISTLYTCLPPNEALSVFLAPVIAQGCLGLLLARVTQL